MKHLGDITKIDVLSLPEDYIVDCICGGSPCQNLSLAGKREGLAGERSGLFMEQVRIIKEMRELDGRLHGRSSRPLRPRFNIWENVKGSFSSNGGRDFATVLTEFVRIAEPEAPDVPVPPKGRWPKNGCLYDEMGRWSVAWTLHNASDWCVPQRRERVSVVCDFGGLSAPEILFERKGLLGNPAESGDERQGPATGPEGSTGESDFTLQIRCGKPGGGNNR